MTQIIAHAKLTITTSSHPEFAFFLDLRDVSTNRQIMHLREPLDRIARIYKFVAELEDAAKRVGSKITVIDETGRIL